ncbi:MAG: D-glycero-beta-D-manno-heptose-7-phosphate kinase [Candidatus Omnitrophota bacterium]
MKSKLKTIIQDFKKARVLVVGDLILDEYIWGNVERISPEAPVPVVWADRKTYVPGGAANVANNLRSLGAKVSLAGVVGNDHGRDIMLSQLHKGGIETKAIFIEKERHTTLKSRVFARHQQMVRIDWEHIHPISKEARRRLTDFIHKNIKKFDAVIVEDYGKGVIDRALLRDIIPEARREKKIITVDPKEENLEAYKGVTSITPNRKETENAIRYLKIKDRENKFKVYDDGLVTTKDIKTAGRAILQHLKLQTLLVTLGEQGMWLFLKDGSDQHIPTVAQEVFDVSGAGDTTIATFTLAFCCGATPLEAASLANFAAGIVVGKVGTAVITGKELLERVQKL